MENLNLQDHKNVIPLENYKQPQEEKKMKGNIYPTKYGYQVRFGRKICRHFKELTRMLNHF